MMLTKNKLNKVNIGQSLLLKKISDVVLSYIISYLFFSFWYIYFKDEMSIYVEIYFNKNTSIYSRIT